MIKWKLMLTTLPFVLVALGVKLGLEFGIQFPGVIEFGDVGLVLTGGVFLIGFMLAGTMADYKESEKLPAELACALETIEDTLVQAAASKPTLDAKKFLAEMMAATDRINDWLYRKIKVDAVYSQLEQLAAAIRTVEQAGATPYGVRAVNELSGLRKNITRISVISRTDFLATGYALLETLTVIIVALLMFSKFKSIVAECILVSFVTLIYVYMLRLIKDIDDPFEYSADGQAGAAEVDLFPLVEYRDRLKARVGA